MKAKGREGSVHLWRCLAGVAVLIIAITARSAASRPEPPDDATPSPVVGVEQKSESGTAARTAHARIAPPQADPLTDAHRNAAAGEPSAGHIGLRRARIIGALPSTGTGLRDGRDAIACGEPGASANVGDVCLCDVECCGLSLGNACLRGQCINNQCAASSAPLDSVCDSDGNWCTLERCDGDGNCLLQNDGGGACQPDGTYCLSRCPRVCGGGPNDGRACDRASDCPGGRCLIRPDTLCNPLEQRCQVWSRCDGGTEDGNPCLSDADCAGAVCDGGLGRCCKYTGSGRSEDTQRVTLSRGGNAGDRPARSAAGEELFDLVYLFDGSGSIDAPTFEQQKAAIRQTICGTSAVVPPDGTVAVAVIQFSGNSEVEVPLTVIDSVATADSVCAAIDIINQLSGITYMAPGLASARNIFMFDAAGTERHLFISTDSSVGDTSESTALCDDLRSMPIPVKICAALVGEPCPQENEFLKNCANTSDSVTYDPSQPEGEYRCVTTPYEYELLVRDCTMVSPCVNMTSGECAADGGLWLRMQDETEQAHCWCPLYSSGIAPPGNTLADVHPVIASPKICALGGNRCEDTGTADCYKRCIGGINFGQVCADDIDCPGSACISDQCVVDPNACANGVTSLGDDYTLHKDTELRLREFQFHGGVENPGEIVVFEIYDAQQVYVGGFEVQFNEAGIHYWRIAVDCYNDCEPNDNEFPQDPPLIIPPTGFIVMRSTRTMETILEANAHWISTSSPADVGTNDPNTLWVNDQILDWGETEPDVLSFELVGEPVTGTSGACCRQDQQRATCLDTSRWTCGTCTMTGDPCAHDRDCGLIAGTQLRCLFSDWFGPISHADFVNQQGELCGSPPTPCDRGACCDPMDGTCVEAAPEACPGDPANWLGAGTRCSPNCCPQPPTGGDCAYPIHQCRTGGECADGRVCSGSGSPCETIGDCPPGDACAPNWTGMPCNPDDGEQGNPACLVGEQCLGHFDAEPCDPAHGDDDCAPGAVCALRCAGPDHLDLALPGRFECQDLFGDFMGALCDPANGNADCTVLDPSWLCEFALGDERVVSFSGDSSPAEFGVADGDFCSFSSRDVGWYEGFILSNPTEDPVYDCAVVTVDLCCTDPPKSPIWLMLRDVGDGGCSAVGPDTNEFGEGRYGFGLGCEAEHCCVDGNFSATYTLTPGTYVWSLYGTPTCQGTVQPCDAIGTDDDCAPGVICQPNLGAYTGHFTAGLCPVAACCVQDECSRTNWPACKAAGGYWLGEGAVDNPVADCAFNPCTSGACCIGPSQCAGGPDYDTLEDCLANGGPAAQYVGGASCQDDPCPVCSFADDTTCKEDDPDGIMVLSDRYQNSRVADDFHPAGGTIEKICWTPGFLGPNQEECSAPNETPPDDWIVWFYPDDGSGVPDETDPIAGPLEVTIDAKVAHGGDSRLWDYAGTLEAAVMLGGSDCYWLELTGMGNRTCNTYLSTALEGNRHAMVDVADPGTYSGEDARAEDIAFCLDSALIGGDDCGPVLGACCRCPEICEIGRTQAECQACGGSWIQNHSCVPDLCPGVPENDDCAGATVVDGLPLADAVIDFQNVCATDDGPYFGCGNGYFHFDVWYRYTAEACGLLTVSMCETTPFDTMLAFYDGTAACPVASTDELWTCGDGSDRCCGDDTCGIAAGPAELSLQMAPGEAILVRVGGWHDPSTGGGDSRGWGTIRFSLDLNCPTPFAPLPEPGGPLCTPGITICHGGPNEGQFCATDLDCGADGSCRDDCWGEWLGADCVVFNQASSAARCYATKNRYLTVDPTVNSQPVAYQVELAASAPYGAAVGRTWWVAGPVCYDFPGGNPVPGATTCTGNDFFGWVANLTSTPVTRTWTEAPVHVSDCGVVPVATYEFRASHDGGISFSEPLVISTIHDPPGSSQSWGDVTGGPNLDGTWLPADRATSFADVSAAIRAFENRADAAGHPPRIWTDLEINKVINLGDISFLIMAFQGRPYADVNLALIGINPLLCP